MWSSTFGGVETFKHCAGLSALKVIVRGEKMSKHKFTIFCKFLFFFLVVQNKKGNREGGKEGRKKGRHFCDSTP